MKKGKRITPTRLAELETKYKKHSDSGWLPGHDIMELIHEVRSSWAERDSKPTKGVAKKEG